MSTPKQNTRISADQWRARYAEICREYPDRPPERALNRTELDRIRQWEEFQHAIQTPLGGRWRVLRIPRDPTMAFRALAGYVEGLPDQER